MKKIFIILILVLMNCVGFSQITLETTIISQDTQATGFIQLENSGKKYFIYDRENWTLTLYNTNNSVYSIIQINTTDLGVNDYPNFDGSPEISCISENLFNTDNEIEFLISFEAFTSDYQNSIIKTVIIDNDGGILFEAIDQLIPTMWLDLYIEQFPNWICNTDDGTKMILVGHDDENLYIYDIPGSVPTMAVNSELGSINSKLYSYPNPTKSYSTIEYQIPDGIKTAEIVLYDMTGKEIKRFTVDKNFNNLTISTSDLKQGTYLYSLQTNNRKINGNKMIVIN